jgi:broad specificity phosphatase PhoE
VNIDVTYNPPAPDKDLVDRNRFILIRHGVTNFNVVFGDVVAKHGFNSEEFRRLKVDPDFIDIELKAEGVTQCENASLHAKDINFKVVFVSQMVRAV